MAEKAKITVIDLDGTLLRGNSMVMLARWLPKTLLRQGEARAALRCYAAIALRLCRMSSHWQMKQTLIRETAFIASWEPFIDILEKRLEPGVRQLALQSPRTVLATAASVEYSQPLAERLGCFEKVIATEGAMECRGEEKKRRVINYAGSPQEIEWIITDHLDDLPLLKSVPEECRLLVNPNSKTRRLLTSLGVKYRLFASSNC